MCQDVMVCVCVRVCVRRDNATSLFAVELCVWKTVVIRIHLRGSCVRVTDLCIHVQYEYTCTYDAALYFDETNRVPSGKHFARQRFPVRINILLYVRVYAGTER